MNLISRTVFCRQIDWPARKISQTYRHGLYMIKLWRLVCKWSVATPNSTKFCDPCMALARLRRVVYGVQFRRTHRTCTRHCVVQFVYRRKSESWSRTHNVGPKQRTEPIVEFRICRRQRTSTVVRRRVPRSANLSRAVIRTISWTISRGSTGTVPCAGTISWPAVSRDATRTIPCSRTISRTGDAVSGSTGLFRISTSWRQHSAVGIIDLFCIVRPRL